MEQFYTIRFKRKTAQRFKKFSKKISKTYSGTLDAVMDFFEWHGFKPNDRFVDSILEEIRKNRKRTEANIAILRDIEINQTKPNNAMLLSLFGANTETKKQPKIERKLRAKPSEKLKEIEVTVPKIRYERLESKMKNITQDFQYVLDNVTTVKSPFGKEFLKLDISKNELEKFMIVLKNIEQ